MTGGPGRNAAIVMLTDLGRTSDDAIVRRPVTALGVERAPAEVDPAADYIIGACGHP